MAFAPLLLNAHNPGPMTGSGNNTYLLIGSSGSAALIDAGVGHPQHLAQLDAVLHDRDARLERVLVTHGHRDHVEGAPAIAAAHAAAQFAKKPWPGEDIRYAVEWQPLVDLQVVVGGDERLTVVDTPGHSPDHVAFWHEESGTIFTGDLVVLGSSVMIHWSRGGDVAQYIASLGRLLALKPVRLLPAHGHAIDRPAAILISYINHRLEREQQVLAAVRAGYADVQAIAESIYDGLDPALMPAARENVRAHLEKLKTDGIATDEGGRWRV